MTIETPQSETPKPSALRRIRLLLWGVVAIAAVVSGVLWFQQRSTAPTAAEKGYAHRDYEGHFHSRFCEQ